MSNVAETTIQAPSDLGVTTVWGVVAFCGDGGLTSWRIEDPDDLEPVKESQVSR
jgi:hypothetical protein